MDCGPICLYMIRRNYGSVFPLEKLWALTQKGKEGLNLLGTSDAAETIGFQTTLLKLSFTKLIDEAPKPAILHWGQNHFIVLPLQKTATFSKPKNITIADPAKGIITISKELFLKISESDKNADRESICIFFQRVFLKII